MQLGFGPQMSRRRFPKRDDGETACLCSTASLSGVCFVPTPEFAPGSACVIGAKGSENQSTCRTHIKCDFSCNLVSSNARSRGPSPS
jgi:hypothetical protein